MKHTHLSLVGAENDNHATIEALQEIGQRVPRELMVRIDWGCDEAIALFESMVRPVDEGRVTVDEVSRLSALPGLDEAFHEWMLQR